MSKLAAASRRIRFVILRTAGSPPVALHPASRRRSYLRLRSLQPAPARTCTVLTKRPHGRTHSRESGGRQEIPLPLAGEGRGPSRRDGKGEGMRDLGAVPHPPIAAQRVPPSP